MITQEQELTPQPRRVGVYVVEEFELWVSSLIGLQVHEGLVVWNDPENDPDEPIRAVYVLPHFGGLVQVVTDRNLYVLRAATFGAETGAT